MKERKHIAATTASQLAYLYILNILIVCETVCETVCCYRHRFIFVNY